MAIWLAPPRAKDVAMALPMPLDAPLMKTARSFRRDGLSLLGSIAGYVSLWTDFVTV